MSTKHTATLPDGQVVTRTSKGRVYAHAVAMQKPAAAFRREDELGIIHDRKQIAKLTRDLARLNAGEAKDSEGRRFLIRNENGAGDHDFLRTRPEMIADYERYIADYHTSIAQREARLAADEYTDDAWGCAGWQSRRDLAVKEAARWVNHGWRSEILDATAVEVVKKGGK